MSEKEIDLSKLAEALRRDRRVLQRYRDNRARLVRLYAGKNYSEETYRDKATYVNLLGLYISIVGRNLIANNPRALLSTTEGQHKPIVSALQSAVNDEVEHMRLGKTLQRCDIDALFSVGFCKVALATPADAAVYSWNLKAGRPYACRVDLDDIVFDTYARDFEEVRYIGHRYCVPLDTVQGSPYYNRKQARKLQPTEPHRYNEGGDERVGEIGRGSVTGYTEEFDEQVELWEIYFPRHRQVLTFATDESGVIHLDKLDEPLRAQKWIGPECGPYHILGFNVVPGNIMPVGPLQHLQDLHNLANELYRKLARQASRQKEVLFVRGGATEEGERALATNDGEASQVDDPSKLVVQSWGGPDQKNFAMFEQAKALFDWAAGNLSSMGGLSAMAKTATQDKMLEENSSKAIQDLQEQCVDFTSSVVRALAWYLHHDPERVYKSVEQIPGLPGMAFNRLPLTPQRRQQVPFEQMRVKVDPYSLPRTTPVQRLQFINQMVEKIMPIMPMLQQQGIAFDANFWLQKNAEYGDMPDLAQLFTIREPPAEESGKAPPAPGMPQNTQRSYIRENMPARTERGDAMHRMNAAMGINVGGEHKNGQQNGVYQ